MRFYHKTAFLQIQYNVLSISLIVKVENILKVPCIHRRYSRVDIVEIVTITKNKVSGTIRNRKYEYT